MVVRLITGKSLKGILNYNEHKVHEGKAELLSCHLFLREPHELTFHDKLRRFEGLQEKSPQVKTNALHISLNFAMGEYLETERLEAIAAGYMERIGFGEQPYLVYRHLDAAHPHLHIVTTNIRPDGSRIDLHNIGRNQSEQARKALELEFGLVQAERQQQQKLLPLTPVRIPVARYGKTETKRTVSAIVTAVTRGYNYTSLHELNAVLQAFGVTAYRGPETSNMHRNRGLVYQIINDQGLRTGVPIKASALPGKPTLAYLEKRFARNQKLRQPCQEQLRRSIDRVMRAPALNPEKFTRKLQQENIAVLFRKSAEGKIYGVTFIDHRHRAVFNGRELGKAYGAKALLERFTENKQLPEATVLAQPGKLNGPKPTQAHVAQSHAPVPPTLEALWKTEQQVEQVSYPLRKQKRKKRKKKPSIH